MLLGHHPQFSIGMKGLVTAMRSLHAPNSVGNVVKAFRSIAILCLLERAPNRPLFQLVLLSAVLWIDTATRSPQGAIEFMAEDVADKAGSKGVSKMCWSTNLRVQASRRVN